MADFVSAFTEGANIGNQNRGRFSGLIDALNTVIDKRNQKVQTQEALDLLGKTEDIKMQRDPEKMFKKALYERALKGQQGGEQGNLLGNSTSDTIKIDALGNLKSVSTLTPKEQVENISNQEILNEAQRTGKSVGDIIQYKKIKEDKMMKASKPYSDKSAATIALTNSVVPLIDDIVSMVEEEGNIFGNLGLGDLITTAPLSGQSRLGAFTKPPTNEGFDFMSPFKKGLVIGKGREIGNKMTEVVQTAFEKGGATLTKQEILASLAGLNPEYKTEKEWVNGLKRMKQQLLEKKELISKESDIENLNDDFSNMSNEELRAIINGR